MWFPHQCHILMQSLSDCMYHILEHSQVTVPELSAAVCGSTTFFPTDPVCRRTSSAAAISSSSTVRLMSTPYQVESASADQLYSLMEDVFDSADVMHMVVMRWSVIYDSALTRLKH